MTTTSSNNSPTVWAILRARQKDDQYVERLATSLNESLKTLIGVRAWIRYQDLVGSLSNLFYYLLTTGSGRQTLGEEYCSLLQVVNSGQQQTQRLSFSIPSTSRRLLLCLLTSFHTTLLNSFITFLKSICEKYLHLRNSTHLTDELREGVQTILSTAQAVNTAVFYFTGRYSELLKRLLSIGYLSTVTSTSGGGFFGCSAATSTSKLLGCLSGLQIILSLYTKYNLWKIPSTVEERPYHQQNGHLTPEDDGESCSNLSDDNEKKKKCLLCLSPRSSPTLLECGHIFCWHCLTSWLQFRAECPTCRRTIAETNRLVYLHNYN